MFTSMSGLIDNLRQIVVKNKITDIDEEDFAESVDQSMSGQLKSPNIKRGEPKSRRLLK